MLEDFAYRKQVWSETFVLSSSKRIQYMLWYFLVFSFLQPAPQPKAKKAEKKKRKRTNKGKNSEIFA